MHAAPLFRPLAALALLAALCGCSRPASFPAAGAEAPDPGYRGPPTVLGVEAGSGGGMLLAGQAAPSAQIQLLSPAGEKVETRADGRGAWRAALGPVSEPTLYALSEEAGGRRVEAEGLVAILPGSPTVALLRAGAGAAVVAPAGPGPAILAVDYDRGGATVVSGRAAPGAPVQVQVDGAPMVDGAAGPDGRFSLALPKPLTPGERRIRAGTPKGAAEAVVTVTAPAPPADGPFRAAAGAGGWRIDWVTPGGGPQATVLPGAAPPA